MINWNHLKETQNTWTSHFCFAFREACEAALIALIMVIHAFAPFLLSSGWFDRYVRGAYQRLEDDQARWKNDT